MSKLLPIIFLTACMALNLNAATWELREEALARRQLAVDLERLDLEERELVLQERSVAAALRAEEAEADERRQAARSKAAESSAYVDRAQTVVRVCQLLGMSQTRAQSGFSIASTADKARQVAEEVMPDGAHHAAYSKKLRTKVQAIIGEKREIGGELWDAIKAFNSRKCQSNAEAILLAYEEDKEDEKSVYRSAASTVLKYKLVGLPLTPAQKAFERDHSRVAATKIVDQYNQAVSQHVCALAIQKAQERLSYYGYHTGNKAPQSALEFMANQADPNLALAFLKDEFAKREAQGQREARETEAYYREEARREEERLLYLKRSAAEERRRQEGVRRTEDDGVYLKRTAEEEGRRQATLQQQEERAVAAMAQPKTPAAPPALSEEELKERAFEIAIETHDTEAETDLQRQYYAMDWDEAPLDLARKVIEEYEALQRGDDGGRTAAKAAAQAYEDLIARANEVVETAEEQSALTPHMRAFQHALLDDSDGLLEQLARMILNE